MDNQIHTSGLNFGSIYSNPAIAWYSGLRFGIGVSLRLFGVHVWSYKKSKSIFKVETTVVYSRKTIFEALFYADRV